MWNGFVLRELVQQAELSRFCLPIMHGCIFCFLAIYFLVNVVTSGIVVSDLPHVCVSQ